MIISTWFDYDTHDSVNWFEFIFNFGNRILQFANAVWNILTTSIQDIITPIITSLPNFIGFGLSTLISIFPSSFLQLNMIQILGGAGLVFIVGLTLAKLIPIL